jgi:hypothetical protein
MKRVLSVAALATGLSLAGFWLLGGSRSAKADPTPSFSAVAGQCASSVGSDGYGSATITQDLYVLNETDDLSQPCVLHLAGTAGIVITNSQIRTRHLVIVDEGTGPHTIQLEHSSLAAAGTHGLVLRLQNAHDRLLIQDSSITYPLAIWILINGIDPNPGGGEIDVIGSTLQSTDPASSGIDLIVAAAGGVGNFVNDTFVMPSGANQVALLYAGTCKEQSVTGAVPVCTANLTTR